ncbi:MAG: hypothetical protein WCT37_04270 [Patescibacteria group bacterium]|jgi:hypothetical protein
METTNQPHLQPVSALFAASWRFFKEHLKNLLQIVIVMMIPNALIVVIAILINLTANGDNLGLFVILGILVFILYIIGAILQITGALGLIHYIHRRDKTLKLNQIFNFGWNLFWDFVGEYFVVMVIILLTALLFAIPGIIFAVWYSLFVFILVCEGQKGHDSARQSRRLVSGNWWGVFGRYLLLGLIYCAAYLIFLIPGWATGNGWIMGTGGALYFIFAIFMSPFATVFVYHLYQNLKQVKNL